MCSSEQPLNGADSPDSYVTLPYLVVVEEEYGSRLMYAVRALGPNDARRQAIEKAHDEGHTDVTAITIEEAPS